MEINTISELTHNHLRHAPIFIARKAWTTSSTFVKLVIKIVSITSLTNIIENHLIITSINDGYMSCPNYG